MSSLNRLYPKGWWLPSCQSQQLSQQLLCLTRSRSGVLGLQLLNMLEVAAISAGTPFFPEGWQTATAWLVRLVGLAWGQREGVACLGFWDNGTQETLTFSGVLPSRMQEPSSVALV